MILAMILERACLKTLYVIVVGSLSGRGSGATPGTSSESSRFDGGRVSVYASDMAGGRPRMRE